MGDKECICARGHAGREYVFNTWLVRLGCGVEQCMNFLRKLWFCRHALLSAVPENVMTVTKNCQFLKFNGILPAASRHRSQSFTFFGRWAYHLQEVGQRP